ncbi:MAG TPA: hypothetical protein PK869_00355, partial [Candidatus Hydrogenedentes bacterium]|nr:hypothetical protein [Candidatus Hydrogenedentota bacterium]
MKLIAAMVVAVALFSVATFAHVGDHPSVHDTVAGVIDRMKTTIPVESLKTLSLEQVEGLLTDEEKHVLATEHLSFDINVPVDLYVVR